MFGMIEFTYKTAIGEYALSMISILTILVFFFCYSFIFYSFFKFSDRKLYYIVAIVFFFPYVLLVLVLNCYAFIYEALNRQDISKWEKVS